jgi:hypothetical protein
MPFFNSTLMDKAQITKFIEDSCSATNKPFVTRVMCKNDVTHYGYFNSFDDYNELKEKDQYRFIPRNNFMAFKNEYSEKGKYNVNHSIVLAGEDLVDIEFVLPLHI